MAQFKIINNNKNLGILGKPHECKTLCPYFYVGEGFVRDIAVSTARVLIMINNPSSDDLVNRKLLSGRAGYRFYQDYIYSLGYTDSDVAVTAVMRCRPKGGKMPTGPVKPNLITACRYYDREVIKEFNPDCYLITQELRDVYQERAFHSLLKCDIQKAFFLAEKGYRPIVLMGLEAANLVASFVDGNGGPKRWRGMWEELTEGWPHLNASPAPKPIASGFAPAGWKK